MIFPVKNWAAYALAMTTCGTGLYLCWMLARRVTDSRARCSIPMFFLVPIALVAVPKLAMHRRAPLRLVAVWLLISLGALAASPWLVAQAGIETAYAGRSQLARELTTLWRERFGTRWEAVVAPVEISELMPFYSPDRPAALAPGDRQPSGIVTPDSLKRTGFIGVCATGDIFAEICEAWMAANAPGAERISMTTRRYFDGRPGPVGHYRVVIVPPGR